MKIEVPFIPFDVIPTDRDALVRFDQEGSRKYRKFVRPIVSWEFPDTVKGNAVVVATIEPGLRQRIPVQLAISNPQPQTVMIGAADCCVCGAPATRQKLQKESNVMHHSNGGCSTLMKSKNFCESCFHEAEVLTEKAREVLQKGHLEPCILCGHPGSGCGVGVFVPPKAIWEQLAKIMRYKIHGDDCNSEETYTQVNGNVRKIGKKYCVCPVMTPENGSITYSLCPKCHDQDGGVAKAENRIYADTIATATARKLVERFNQEMEESQEEMKSLAAPAAVGGQGGR